MIRRFFAAAWPDVRTAWGFAFTRAVPLVVLELLILLAVLNQLGDGFGAFFVLWKDPTEPLAALDFDRAIFWNGVGVGLFGWCLAYMNYLLLARENAAAAGRRMALLYARAVPLLVFASLPVFLPGSFDPGEERKTLTWLEVAGKRIYFPLGMLVAAVAFAGLVVGLSALGRVAARKNWVSLPASRKDRVARQADGLFALVLAGFAGLVGYTLGDSRGSLGSVWLWLGLAVVALAAAARWGAKRSECAARWIGRVAVVSAAVVVLVVSGTHWFGVGAAGVEKSVYLAVVFVIWAAQFLVRKMELPQAAGWVSYSAAAVGIAAAGGAAGFLVRTPAATGNEITVLPAALSVCLLVAVAGVGYGVLRFYTARGFYPVLGALAAGLLLLATIRPYPHHLAELDAYYGWADAGTDAHAGNRFVAAQDPPADARRVKPRLAEYVGMRKQHEAAAAARLAARPADPWPARLQLDDAVVTQKWAAALNDFRRRPRGSRPPMVLVATAGGASTSALFTFGVLAELEHRIPGFHRHVRVVAGASGGMLGGAVYRAWLRELDRLETEKKRPLTPAEVKASGDEWGGRLERDFLSPVVQALAFKDVPMNLLVPFGYADDRGRRLERAWERYLGGALNVTFAELRVEERAGRFPSLVFSPMMVEDGRPLFISTLDLDGLAVVPTGADSAYPSRTRGVEFFKLFPEHGWDLRLGTAARMSATFPFVSPAATLPTIPPRRVVDAGYYENYGVGTLLAWAENAARNQTLIPTAGPVVVLELRPYGAWTDSALSADELKGSAGVPQVADPLQEFVTPLEGAYAARGSTMITRNNDQYALLANLFEAVAGDLGESAGGGLRNVVFKADLRASLNWSLPKNQVQEIRDAVAEIFGTGPGRPGRVELNRKEWEELRGVLTAPPERSARPSAAQKK